MPSIIKILAQPSSMLLIVSVLMLLLQLTLMASSGAQMVGTIKVQPLLLIQVSLNSKNLLIVKPMEQLELPALTVIISKILPISI